MTEVALSTLTWVSMLVSLLPLPGVMTAVLVRSFRTEECKPALLREQDDVDSYLPRVFSDLREWTCTNPDDSYSPIARRRYNECMWPLQVIDEPHYDWPDEQIARLELVDE